MVLWRAWDFINVAWKTFAVMGCRWLKWFSGLGCMVLAAGSSAPGRSGVHGSGVEAFGAKAFMGFMLSE